MKDSLVNCHFFRVWVSVSETLVLGGKSFGISFGKFGFVKFSMGKKVSVSENLVSDKNVSVSVEILVPSVIIEQLTVHLRQTLQLSDDRV